MKLELKNVKYAKFASEETACYSAVVYKDGKRWAHVSNSGHGGPDQYGPVKGPYNCPEFQKEYKAVNDFLAASPEGQAYTQDCINRFGDKHILKYNLESWCSDALEDFLLIRDLKKLLKKQALFVMEGDLRGWSWPNVRTVTEQHLASVRKKAEAHGGLLNDMSFDKAFKIFKEVA